MCPCLRRMRKQGSYPSWQLKAIQNVQRHICENRKLTHILIEYILFPEMNSQQLNHSRVPQHGYRHFKVRCMASRQSRQLQLCYMERHWVRSIFHSYIMTSSNGNIFRVTGPLCGEFTGPGEFPTQRPVTRSFDVFFGLRLNKRLSKQPWGWWFETLSWSLWRHCNDIYSLWPLHNIAQSMSPNICLGYAKTEKLQT